MRRPAVVSIIKQEEVTFKGCPVTTSRSAMFVGAPGINAALTHDRNSGCSFESPVCAFGSAGWLEERPAAAASVTAAASPSLIWAHERTEQRSARKTIVAMLPAKWLVWLSKLL